MPCSPGSYYDMKSSTCKLCQVGQYQSREGQTSCASCTPGYTTTGPGATALIHCKSKFATSKGPHCHSGCFNGSVSASCLAGRSFNLDTALCEDCGYGFYQPSPGSFECIPCGVGMSTFTTTSTNPDECHG